MLPLSISAYHGLPYRVVSRDATTYYVHIGCGLDNLGFDELSLLFDNSWRRDHVSTLTTKGGRGQTVLFDLPLAALNAAHAEVLSKTHVKDNHGSYENGQAFMREVVADATWPELQDTMSWCYRLYLRGGVVGKVISNKFCRFASTAHRARDEFLMLLKMRLLGLPVPRPIVAKETVGLCMMTNEIVIEQLAHTENLFEVMSKRKMSDDEGLKLGRTLASFFQYNIHHTDLNLRNILLDEKGDFYLIDFDKCHFEENPYSSPILVQRMIDRLQRSFAKALAQNPDFHYQDAWLDNVRKATLSTLISLTQDDTPLSATTQEQIPQVTTILANLIIGQNWNISEAQAQFAQDPQLKAQLIEAEQRWLADKANALESSAAANLASLGKSNTQKQAASHAAQSKDKVQSKAKVQSQAEVQSQAGAKESSQEGAQNTAQATSQPASQAASTHGQTK